MTVHPMLEEDTTDPTLAPFLALLAGDMAAWPASAVRPVPDLLIDRAEALSDGPGETDPDSPIEGEVSL